MKDYDRNKVPEKRNTNGVGQTTAATSSSIMTKSFDKSLPDKRKTADNQDQNHNKTA